MLGEILKTLREHQGEENGGMQGKLQGKLQGKIIILLHLIITFL